MVPRLTLIACTVISMRLAASGMAQDALPFSYTVETFQEEEDPDIKAFVVKLKQPFLAEEFEKSNYLRLKALDDGAFLIYPRETKFEQKHAEFYGRLRGEGSATLQLSYETVSENPDGSRRVISRQAEFEVEVPFEKTGSETLYRAWAQQQNQHFADLLEYYPGESFFEYLLLQSRQRYGVTPPALSRLMPDKDESEEGLYRLFSSGLELQQSLQRHSLRTGSKPGDLTIHISQVPEPDISSLDYKELLKQQVEDGRQPNPHPAATLIPEDQFLLQLNSYEAADNLRTSFQDWVEPLARLFRENARDHHLWDKYESQLLITFSDLQPLFADKSVTSLAVTGSDFFVAEGTDLTVLLKTDGTDQLDALITTWIQRAEQQRPDMENRDFNYRGFQIGARYTADRKISSFIIRHDGWVVISNSHVGIRRIVDTIQNNLTPLADADDYQYATVLLPPSAQATDGYFYCSDAFLRYLFSPSFKVGERRRKQSLNNLVMLNNASLFHRLEYGRSPENLTDLIEGRFVDQDRIVCPQGGAYAFDQQQDTSTSSVFNRIKYLTPIRELKVLKISANEKSEYERYQQRLSSFWQKYFTPVALRLSTAPTTQVDFCLMPFANPAERAFFKELLREDAQPLQLSRVAESVFASFNLLGGRERIAEMLRALPGVDGVLQDDPTLTDLNWLGDRMSVHFCDTHTVLEVDPTRLRQLSMPFRLGLPEQVGIAAGLFAAAAPVYIGLDVEDQEKADRFLQMLSSRIFLHQQDFGEIGAAIDAYQLPAYKDHQIYVVSYRVYAARIRFYLAAVGDQLVAATEPYVLKQVIDAASDDPGPREVSGQTAFRINTAAMKKLKDDLREYWEERYRRASHRNVMPIYTLIHLYNVSVDEVDAISDAKYGVTYFCPDGEYKYDADRDRVYSTAYGNREEAWQKIADPQNSSFEKTFNRLQQVLWSVDMSEESLKGRFEVKSD
ncbi:MAG: hypothetical protein RIK87_27530 [Fuerstiella sp.]